VPNGGSDCCGTCPFNERNQGEAGYAHAGDPGRDYCTIRDLEIVGSAFYTYCVNHPHHNPGGLDVPIGPVFQGDSFGDRSFWVASPDTPELRRKLVMLAERMPLEWDVEYPFGMSLKVGVIMQLGEWREDAALPALQRIATGDTSKSPVPKRAFARSPLGLVEAAQRAIEQIDNIN
jgi:hypothetical protein